MKISDLKAPFDPKRISWRVGSTTQDKTRGLALAYIDARDVQDRLDEVCGPENWQCRYALQGLTTICEIGIKVGDEWVWKADGAGSTDVEAEKGSLSDAFKRAAVKWGVGRYLYDVEAPWVELEAAGRSFKIKSSEMAKLQALLSRHDGPKPDRPQATPAPALNGHASDPKATEAVDWARKAIVTVRAFKDPKAFDAWYTKKVRDAIVRLKDHDAELQDQLATAVLDALDRFNPIGA